MATLLPRWKRRLVQIDVLIKLRIERFRRNWGRAGTLNGHQSGHGQSMPGDHDLFPAFGPAKQIGQLAFGLRHGSLHDHKNRYFRQWVKLTPVMSAGEENRDQRRW